MTREDVLKMQTYKMFENDTEVYVSRDDVLNALDDGWIPCEDMMPDIDRFVLVQLTDSYRDPIQIMSLHLKESTEDSDGWLLYWKTQEESIEFDAVDIVAWMPLPEPWKGEE